MNEYMIYKCIQYTLKVKDEDAWSDTKKDIWLFISLVFGLYGMTFEGKMRKLSDKFRLKLV